MKPISALYYIKATKSRSLVTIILMFLSVSVYFIGNFINSDEKSYDKSIEYDGKLALISYMSIDEGGKDFDKYVENLKRIMDVKLIPVGSKGGNLVRKSLMGLELSSLVYTFQNASDMKMVFEYLGIELDFKNIKNKSMVISKNLADNLGLKLGDKINNDTIPGGNLVTDFTLDGIVDDNAYEIFYVWENENPYEFYVYCDTEKISAEDFYKILYDVRGDLKVYIKEPLSSGVKNSFSFINVIFYSVAILVAVVLAIVINTVITGFFMKRRYEFGILRAIGISKWNIRRKIAMELIIMDIIGSAIGFLICLITTYLLNNFIYIPSGKYMLYYSKIGVIGYLICNLLVLVPMIISKGSKMAKVDVTEF